MILPFLLMLIAPSDAEAEAACEYCAAIFDDVRLNAMIGNGNVEVSPEWAAGRDGDDVSIRIENLNCPEGTTRKTCSFTLRRMLMRNGVGATDPALPERLECTAILKWFDEDWRVEHTPPRRVGHSTTSMKCKSIETGV